MIWYVALVAVLNLGLGYALAVYFGAARRKIATPRRKSASASYDEFDDLDDYDSESHYGNGLVEAEYESVATE